MEDSGPSIPFEARGSIFESFNIALQGGCEPSSLCNSFHSYVDSDPARRIATTYPMTTPPPRLRVKAFGADPTRHMYFAVWSVEIPDKPTATLTQENGEWLTIDVPSDAISVILYVDVS